MMATSEVSVKRRIETLTRKQAYKALIERGSEINDHIETAELSDTFKDILEIVNECEILSAACPHGSSIADNAAEYLLDAQVVKMSHDLVSSTAEKLGNVEFSDDEFVMSLLNFITTENAVESFNILLPEANKSIYSTKHSISLLGTFDPSESQSQKPEKVKAPRQKRKVATQSEMKAPEKISVLKKSDKGAEKINTTLIQIENIYQKRGRKPILYFELITHPTDFMLSVDNAFQVSFLVRDGLIGMKEMDEDVYVYVSEQTKKSKASITTPTPTAKDSVQTILSINPKMWRENIKKYKIKNPLLVSDFVDPNASQASQSLTQSMMDVDDPVEFNSEEESD